MSRLNFVLCVTHEASVSCMSGSMMGPVGVARRRAMRSERLLRSMFDWAEMRDTESISSICFSREKTKSGI